jgi:hypothetical protein
LQVVRLLGQTIAAVSTRLLFLHGSQQPMAMLPFGAIPPYSVPLAPLLLRSV